MNPALDFPAAARDAASPAATRNGTIVFLLSRSRHARMWRRVNRVAPAFRGSEVLAFERDPTPARFGPYTSLGSISHGRYVRRLFHLTKAARQIRARLRSSDTAYCFSLDLLLIAWLVRPLRTRPVRLVYEVSDIRPLFTRRSPAGMVVRALERWLVRRCAVVVMTSPDFYSGYFAEVQGIQGFPRVIIEHKPEVPPEVRDRVAPRDRRPGTFRIGYFGLLKSAPSFAVLMQAAARYRHIEVVFRGMFVAPLDANRCLRAIERCGNTFYGGPYKSPDDLADLYGDVDLVWDAYTGSDNSRWQRTTRFSEAMFFKRPVITDVATPDGRLAGKLGTGLSINLSDATTSIAALGSIDDGAYARWCDAVERVPEHLIFYGDEYRELLRHAAPGC